METAMSDISLVATHCLAGADRTNPPALDECEPTVKQRFSQNFPNYFRCDLPIDWNVNVRNNIIFLTSFLINIDFIYHNLNDM